MLDGRVSGASQVEYKPFGKPPLKREPGAAVRGLRDLLSLSCPTCHSFFTGPVFFGGPRILHLHVWPGAFYTVLR